MGLNELPKPEEKRKKATSLPENGMDKQSQQQPKVHAPMLPLPTSKSGVPQASMATSQKPTSLPPLMSQATPSGSIMPPPGAAASIPSAGHPIPPHLLRQFVPTLPQKVQSSHLTPAIFKTSKLRSGKWIPEEEAYADALISIFDKGLLKECDNGMTLRAYLSQKLHCAPMRISKKYAGKGIGKMVFLSKLNSHQRTGLDPSSGDIPSSTLSANVAISKEELDAMEKRVKEAEKKFFKALFPHGQYQKLESLAQLRSISVAQPTSVPPQQAAQLPTLPVPSTSTVIPAAQVSASRVSTNTVAAQTKLLHESYMNALKQGAPPAMASKPIATVPPQGLPAVHHALQAALPMQQAQTPIVPMAVAGSNPLQWVPPTATSVQSTNVLQVPQPITAAFVASPHPEQLGVSLTIDLPDFLAGFDKVALSLASGNGELPKPGGPAALAPPVMALPDGGFHYSPTFTSRSFDDFHKYLGKDLTPLNEPSEAAATLTSAPVPAIAQAPTAATGFDTDALFSADSYAMFAQESALAASQHSAYLPHGVAAKHDGTEGPGTYDIEGLMKLVSAHTEPSVVASKQETESSPPKEREAASRAAKRRAPPRRSASDESSVTNAPTTTMERMYRYDRSDNNVVSSSDPSSAAESESATGSMRGITSESTSNGSDNSDCGDNTSDQDNTSDSVSDEGPRRKKAKIAAATKPEYNRGTHLASRPTTLHQR